MKMAEWRSLAATICLAAALTLGGCGTTDLSGDSALSAGEEVLSDASGERDPEQYREAIRLFSTALESGGDPARASLGLGEAYARMASSRAASLSPPDRERYHQLAAEAYSAALDQSGTPEEAAFAHLGRARVYVTVSKSASLQEREGVLGQAIADYEAAVSTLPEPQLMLELASARASQAGISRDHSVTASLQEAATAGDDVRANLLFGQALLAAGSFQSALAVFEATRELTDDPELEAEAERFSRAARSLATEEISGIAVNRPLGVAALEATGPGGIVAREATRTLPPVNLSDTSVGGESGIGVTVLFGTNRRPASPGSGVVRLSSDTNPLTLGAVTVSIPAGHSSGYIERPAGGLATPLGIIGAEAESAEDHFVLRSGSFLTRDEFADLSAYLQQEAIQFENQALVFVHGFNNSFEDAAFRTAQIAYDLEFDGAVYFFSWPSRDQLDGLAYNADFALALASRAAFEEFLEIVAASTPAERIHVVAHSMGAGLTMETLSRMNRREGRRRFAEVILAAPDINRDVFLQLADDIGGVADGITVYASSADKAMDASRVWGGGAPRAGDVPDLGPILAQGIQTIDASAVSLDLFYTVDHSDFAESRELLVDLRALIRDGIRPPDARPSLIEAVGDDSARYWRFRR